MGLRAYLPACESGGGRQEPPDESEAVDEGSEGIQVIADEGDETSASTRPLMDEGFSAQRSHGCVGYGGTISRDVPASCARCKSSACLQSPTRVSAYPRR